MPLPDARPAKDHYMGGMDDSVAWTLYKWRQLSGEDPGLACWSEVVSNLPFDHLPDPSSPGWLDGSHEIPNPLPRARVQPEDEATSGPMREEKMQVPNP